jgi:hypothetical protein
MTFIEYNLNIISRVALAFAETMGRTLQENKFHLSL